MRAGDHHRRPITGADVVQRHQDVDLPAVELAGVIAELRADGAHMAARMEPLRAARRADGAEALVDEGRPVRVVEVLGIVRADEMDRLVVPGRVVEQFLPDRPRFVELLEDDAFLMAVMADGYIAPPAIALDRLGRVLDLVIGRVAGGDLLRRQRILQDQISVQVEQILLPYRCRHAPLRHARSRAFLHSSVPLFEGFTVRAWMEMSLRLRHQPGPYG